MKVRAQIPTADNCNNFSIATGSETAVGTTLDNLKAAAASEDEEVGIYTDYAKTAREEGFADLADFFEGLAAIEKSHENRYQLLIERIENDEVLGNLAAVLDRIAALAKSLPDREAGYISRSDGW